MRLTFVDAQSPEFFLLDSNSFLFSFATKLEPFLVLRNEEDLSEEKFLRRSLEVFEKLEFFVCEFDLTLSSMSFLTTFK